jgi:hypothetical protein
MGAGGGARDNRRDDWFAIVTTQPSVPVPPGPPGGAQGARRRNRRPRRLQGNAGRPGPGPRILAVMAVRPHWVRMASP